MAKNHWGVEAVGFKWTEQDSVDNRLQSMDVGRFYSATIWTPTEMTLKGIAVRVGEKQEASVLFDTELLRVTCGWSGEFLKFDPARFGIIGPPRIGAPPVFSSPRQPGWTHEGSWKDPRPKPFGPLPRQWAKYRGLYQHGDRIVFKYTVGLKEVEVLESPWLETIDGSMFITRELEIAPSADELELLVAAAGAKVELVVDATVGTLDRGDGKEPITAKVAKHEQPVRLKLLFPLSVKSVSSVSKTQEIGTRTTRMGDTDKTSLRQFTRPGPARWTAEITTQGVVSNKQEPLVVDTLTLPFENSYKALMFVSGHDFSAIGEPGGVSPRTNGRSQQVRGLTPSGSPGLSNEFDAAVCTLHGDVWLVSGIDDSLKKLTWKRFATGLFQPLGLKIVKNQIYVVGRDQITRLHDLNDDGEADWYENFNNDGQVTTNGHEYVTCLETDSNGWFYYLKGNANGATDHDGCLLRVSPDGQKLEVFATGFRNANGLGIGRSNSSMPQVFTVAPQEGEWTPGSAIFQVQQGGFYGYVPSAHRTEVPKEFSAPLCWIPRLQDNSCGGQVWVPSGSWQQLGGLPLHLSYGTSRMFLLLREQLDRSQVLKSLLEAASENEIWQGATVPLPLNFESGVMRGRFRETDGHLYVSGLRGWVSNAEKDGCLQRVRYTGKPLDLPLSMTTYQNGVLLKFSDPLDPEEAEDPDNYRVQQWNYRWSAGYGSPEFKVSNPSQEGRDDIDVVSATLKNDGAGASVFLELANFQPVKQLSINASLKSKDGRLIERRIDATINAINRRMYELPTKAPRARKGHLAEAELERLVPGIRCEFVGQVSNLNLPGKKNGQVGNLPHVRRMAAWRFEPVEMQRFKDAETVKLVATGYVVAPQRGIYRFSVEGSSMIELSIGNDNTNPTGLVPVARGLLHKADEVVQKPGTTEASSVGGGRNVCEAQLVRGYNKLWITQTVDRQQLDKAVSLRLLWSSDAFGTEPIPPTALFCERLPEKTELDQAGRELFVRHQCFRCHRVSDAVLLSKSAMPELQAEAPDLIGAESRLRSDWLYAWLLNPSHLRINTPMPRVFPLVPTDEHRQQAADLAEFVSSFRSESVQEAPANGDLEKGRRLWKELGCIGCHRLTGEPLNSTDQRTRLFDMKDKFQPGALRRFLARPHQHFAWNRMPDFQLSPDEAASLTLVLERAATCNPQPLLKGRPQGEAERGKVLFEKLGCRQCHRTAADQPLSKPLLPSLFGKAAAKGCLTPHGSETNRDRPQTIPDYDFDDAEQTALLAFLTKDERTLADDSPTDISRRFVAELRCQVCHARDGRSSLLPEILAEESDTGKLPENVPNLTWVGEKLHASWATDFMSGKTSDRTRPWLRIRMPRFPAHAKYLAEGFAREHGLSSEPEPKLEIKHDLVPIGEALATRAGTLDCRQCHPLGSLPPTGDKNTLLAPGINFALTRERIRYDFYRRFTLDPPRYDVSTRMPKLAADGRKTKITNILDGDARQQFEAVWHFLQTVPSASNDP